MTTPAFPNHQDCSICQTLGMPRLLLDKEAVDLLDCYGEVLHNEDGVLYGEIVQKIYQLYISQVKGKV